MFELHPRLAADCVVLGDLPLCRTLLMNDANFPWVILVPRRSGLREIYELDGADRAQFLVESCELTKIMQRMFGADKMNLAALGNMVPQLHVHHIARFSHDAAWPGPVWGKLPPVSYSEAELADRVTALQAALLPLGLIF